MSTDSNELTMQTILETMQRDYPHNDLKSKWVVMTWLDVFRAVDPAVVMRAYIDHRSDPETCSWCPHPGNLKMRIPTKSVVSEVLSDESPMRIAMLGGSIGNASDKQTARKALDKIKHILGGEMPPEYPVRLPTMASTYTGQTESKMVNGRYCKIASGSIAGGRYGKRNQ